MTTNWLCNSFLNPELSDLKLSFASPDKKRVNHLPAHSFVLKASSSSVLRRMVSDEEVVAAQDDNSGLKILEFGGVEPQVAVFFLQYIYCEDIPPLSEMQLLHLIKAADMYDLKGLQELCETRLKVKINMDNAIFIYDFLELIESTEGIRFQCLSMLRDNLTNVLQKGVHLSLNEDDIHLLLADEHLIVDNEYLLLRGLLQWAKRRCSLTFQPITKKSMLEAFQPFSGLVNWCSIDIVDSVFPDPDIKEFLTKLKTASQGNKNSQRSYSRKFGPSKFVWPLV